MCGMYDRDIGQRYNEAAVAWLVKGGRPLIGSSEVGSACWSVLGQEIEPQIINEIEEWVGTLPSVCVC